VLHGQDLRNVTGRSWKTPSFPQCLLNTKSFLREFEEFPGQGQESNKCTPHGVVQLDSDDLPGMLKTHLDALGGDRNGAAHRCPSLNPQRAAGGRRRSREPCAPQSSNLFWPQRGHDRADEGPVAYDMNEVVFQRQCHPASGKELTDAELDPAEAHQSGGVDRAVDLEGVASG
jgi:hypothetical protein